MTENQLPTFWITGYLPNGCKVSYTVPINYDPYGEALLFTDTLLSRGFTTVEPGLNAGEKKDKVGYVLRRSVVNERGETPVIDVYADHEQMTWRTVKVYLNTPEQIAEFEHVSGLKLDSLPYYEGKDSIERGDPKLGKYVIPVKNVFYAVQKPNQKHIDEVDEEKRKLIPKRVFVRWESANSNIIQDTPKNEPQGANAPSVPLSSIDDKDTAWNSAKSKVEDFCTAVTTYFAGQRVRLSGNDIFGAINIITQQSASRWSELTNITQADAWAACLLHVANGDKAKALIQVINDPVLTKAVNFWSSPGANIEF